MSFPENTVLFSESHDVVSRIRGQQVAIPDMRELISSWPHKVNKNVENARAAMSDILKRFTFSETMTQKLERFDTGLLVSGWYPEADLDILLDLTYFTGWMYLVDDQLDALNGPTAESVNEHRRMTSGIIGYCNASLGLETEQANGQVQAEGLISGAKSFKEVSEGISRRYSIDQRKLFMTEAQLTLSMYQREHDIRQSKRLPTLDEYFAYRLGSSCMGMTVALVELSLGLSIPSKLMQSQEMETLRLEANTIQWIMNDIISCKKEVAGGFAENLVPLCSGPECNAQAGVDAAIKLLKESIDRFNEAAEDCLQNVSDSPQLLESVQNFIKGCQYLVTGSLEWSLQTFRYGLASSLKDDEGNLLVEL